MIRRFVTALSLLSMILFAAPTTALAYNPLGGVDCGDKQNANSAVCNAPSGGDPLTGTHGLLIKITDIIAFIAGAAAVIVLIIGGIKFVTSSGDANSVASARSAVINALIGIIVIALARTFIVYLIKHI
jgi:hypothetical protein